MLKYTLFILIFALSTVAAFTQTSAVCDVQLTVYSIENIREETPVPLKGVKIVLKNSAGKTIKPSSGGEHLYAKLPGVDYEVIATLDGYKTSNKTFKPMCLEETVPLTGSAEYVFMWKGNPKEKMDLPIGSRGVFAVSGSSDSTGVKTAEKSEAPILNGKSVKLVAPPYPRAAAAVRASGAVNVQVTIDELGYVVSAKAVSGHPMLRAAAEKAARESKFTTTTLEGFPVKVTGIIVYNFQGK